MHFNMIIKTSYSICLYFVSHCYRCHANNNNRQKMWLGIWRKFGVDLQRLASYDDETLISVLFGNFDLIGNILDVKYKVDFYCYLARFIHIQRLIWDGIM